MKAAKLHNDNNNSEIEIKHQQIIRWLKEKNEKVIVALSGGVDSALVAWIAKNTLGKDNVLAVTANYQTLSDEELETAKKVAKEIDLNHEIIEYNELKNSNFIKNDELRCFHCRNELADRLLKISKEKNFNLILDGSNKDDLGDFRPGMKALQSKGIESPLIEAGFRKLEIRQMAKMKNISIYDKPSNACLASRISKGIEITESKLNRIDICEQFLKKNFKINQVRVRDHGNLARIEVEKCDLVKLFSLEKLEKIEVLFKQQGFNYITLDIEGYRKSGQSQLQDNQKLIRLKRYGKQK